MTPFDALVAHCRSVTTAREWLYDFDTDTRRFIATAAAKKYGTDPVEPTTVVVRQVYEALCKPSVLLGVGTCPYDDLELVNDECPDRDCESRRPVLSGRNHHGWLRR